MGDRHAWARVTVLPGACLVGLLFLAGCGGSGLPSTVTVTGSVTYKGNPVEGASVVFSRGARHVAQGELAIGKTDAAGRFELTTHFGPQASAGGAVPGDYEVTVSKHIPPPGVTQAQYQAMVDAAKKIGETGAMVPADQQPPPQVEMFPPHYSLAGKSQLKASVTSGGPNDFTFPLK